MKSNELSDILLRAHELLKLYPDVDLIYILDDLKSLKLRACKEADLKISNENDTKKIDEQAQKILIDKFFEDVDQLSINDIESKLLSEELFPSMKHIKYFAEKIGIDLGRQSRANSIHTIKNHFDRMRINATISKRND